MSAELAPLPNELQKIAILELGEVSLRLPEDLKALKDWIKKQPHLRARTDDQFLAQFLRGCKYSVEKAKQKIDCFYSLKTKCPEIFMMTNVDDTQFRRFHNTGSYCILPTPLHECGPRIVYNGFRYETNEYSIEPVIRNAIAASEILLMSDPYACICGLVFCIDFAKATTAHIMSLTPSIIKKLIFYYEKSLPLRIKAVYLINLSSYAQTVMKMLIQYAPEKLKSRIYLCGTDTSVLEEQLPRKYFPVEYGGENGSLDQLCQDFNKVWDEYREYFKQNAEYGTDESLRLGKKIDFDDDLGIGGSFRKLDVD
ncbi:alpha-tocopherol transfer protein-like isoform X2 [Haematobia irritans]|uniref:alpha-tocopherol transfer protein-like isoform X2 n=1 Tax=Haematobia irritans TaxID=7368 RepID=UPI003F4FEA37